MPTVIVENDISQWDDLTGEVYHCKHPANTALPSDPISLNLVPT
ncbi:hypothetical protein [Acinetobacter baumannii]